MVNVPASQEGRIELAAGGAVATRAEAAGSHGGRLLRRMQFAAAAASLPAGTRGAAAMRHLTDAFN